MVTAIIQARMGSTRLPGKVLADIGGRTMLERVVERASRAVPDVVVATGLATGDDSVAAACDALGVRCVRGSDEDVLDRYRQAARAVGADAVVRITADCPLLDPDVVRAVVVEFESGGRDYVSNVHPPTYPDGLDTEVFTTEALEAAWTEARLPAEREHVTPYLYKHPERFRLGNVMCPVDLSEHRWTVDEPGDLAFVREIYRHVGRDLFGIDDVLTALEEWPELRAHNDLIGRDEGYARSVAADAAPGFRA